MRKLKTALFSIIGPAYLTKTKSTVEPSRSGLTLMQKTNNLKLYQFIVDCGGIKFTKLEYQTEEKQNKVCHTLVLTALRYQPAFTDVVEGWLAYHQEDSCWNRSWVHMIFLESMITGTQLTFNLTPVQ